MTAVPKVQATRPLQCKGGSPAVPGNSWLAWRGLLRWLLTLAHLGPDLKFLHHVHSGSTPTQAHQAAGSTKQHFKAFVCW